MDFAQANSSVLDQEFSWFQRVLEKRMQDYFDPENSDQKMEVSTPKHDSDSEVGLSTYVKFIEKYKLSKEERIVILLALAPEVKPQFLDIFFTKNKGFDRGFTEFGGILGKTHSGFLPTIETALFILAGDNLAKRLASASLFEPDHIFQRCNIIDLERKDSKEPFAGTSLRLSPDTLDFIIHGKTREPKYSEVFPAKKLDTLMDWEDLVLSSDTHEQLSELRAWLDHGHELLNHWRLEKQVKPGYRCLFYGPPGTGKTLTACLLGKISTRNVYRIDLSQLVSKYIGETEKNLERIFSQAERRDWILFFDEADALFGKRTQISSSNDRFANQGTAYLLQRIEDCPNIVILATNQKANIDEAFTRRFQSIVHFPMPQKNERLKLWERGFSPVSTLDDDIDLSDIAENYVFSGGAIVNVVRYCSLMAIKRKSKNITAHDLKAGLLREYKKEGKTP